MSVGKQRFGTFFEGTSIIIPTFTQHRFLQKCIGSIMDNTDLPYEIIVVDNASRDDTAAYLQDLGGQVRYRVLETNRGYAGAVNVGLTMAKGTTILLLSDDTLVTHNWLENMLRCLRSDPRIGLVGPVTNQITGHQRIQVSYKRTKEMPAFAREHNRSDSKRWRQTDRLTGFCLLFRRELFEQIGFFDEGNEIGNDEEEDYNIRVRLLGKSLVTAGDTFIHHYGSMSMKTLDKRFQPLEWIELARRSPDFQQGTLPHIAVYYPERIVVQGTGPTVYWIENGQRHPVRGTLSLPPVRVSQVDLRLWPLGDPVDYEVPEREFRGRGEPGEAVSGVVLLQDGTPYHVEGNKVRRIVSQTALSAWNLHLKPVREITPNALSAWHNGLPIIPPPQLRHPL